MLFSRLHSDRTETPVPLENHYAGTTPSACWLIGGGPSLAKLPTDEIRDSPIPKMALNLSGVRLVRPDFWTSYDPSARFHRSVYLDPSIAKFLHRRRALDLVPETVEKVCDCPNTVFFNRDGQRGYADFLGQHHTGIVDWADSMVQALDILYCLGFRVIYFAGCEMRIGPSEEQIQAAADRGVAYNPRQPLRDFVNNCETTGLAAADLDAIAPAACYHFDETKPIRAAADTDAHYFRIAQALRLSRRSIALAGVRVISVTPNSRLNDYFPYESVETALESIHQTVGNPATEPTRGLYTTTETRHPNNLGPMRDDLPPNHNRQKPPQPPDKPVAVPAEQPLQQIQHMQQAHPPIQEDA